MPKCITVLQFADDIAVISNNTALTLCQDDLESSLNIIKTNANELGLDFETDKAKLLHFNNKNIKPGTIDTTFNKKTIKSSETACFLGIVFDYRLTFSAQINKVQTRCNSALNIVKFLRST